MKAKSTGVPKAGPLARYWRIMLKLLDLPAIGQGVWAFYSNYVLFLDTELFALLRGVSFNLLQGRLSVAYIQKRCRFFNFRRIVLGSHVRIKTGARITGPLEVGAGSTIDEGVVITGPVTIGAHCHVNFQAWVDRYVTLEDNVGIGHRTFLLTFNHDSSDPEGRWLGELSFKPITIGRGAWVGAMVFVLPGVSCGRGSIIGAGSVVTKDVPDHVLVVGNPAEVKKEITAQVRRE